jgi:aspartate kinase
MKLIVKKYGGTSVATPTKIKNIAKKIAEESDSYRLVIVLSAMGKTTDNLVSLAKKCSKNPNLIDYDLLVSSGEQISISLLSMALKDLGKDSVAYTGWQAGIKTNNAHSTARILGINANKIKQDLKMKKIVVIAGFQGVNNGSVTTLGRGGSDTSAVAIAAALNASECQIFTDVEGVYTTDPRICETARKIDNVTYEEMLEMSGLGSKVLQLRAVEFASKYNVPLRVMHAHKDGEGTLIKKEEKNVEDALISGIAFAKDESEIMIRGVKDSPGIAASILGPIGEADIEVDMIVQNVGSDGLADFTFTVSRKDFNKAIQTIEKNKKKMNYEEVSATKNIVKVSLIGVGMRSHAGIAGQMFTCLAKKKINIRMISTSEIKISVVIDQKNLENAVKALHNEFKLERK